MKQERQRIRLSHGTLSYLHKGDGPPVVFFHGLNGNAESWLRQLDGLAGSLEMWAWDAPGYGDSDPGGDQLDNLAAAALAFIERVKTGPVHLVGHSMGGLVAMAVAVRAPERVRRLVLSCTHPGHGLSGADAADERYRRRLRELSELPPAEYGARRARGMLPEGTDPMVVAEVARIAAAARAEGMAAAALAIQRANLQAELPRIQAPTLVLTADRDRVAPLAKARPLLDGIADVRHRVLEGLGHAPYIEDSAAYNALLADFLLRSEP